jgi:hypothetical protein
MPLALDFAAELGGNRRAQRSDDEHDKQEQGGQNLYSDRTIVRARAGEGQVR